MQFDANPEDYSAGRLKFSFNSKKYGSAAVRKALERCQHNKCCYSEAKFVRDSVHVEHFRPKGAIGQKGSKNKRYPGYYWLAYEWSNLLLCKAGVNSDKSDLFPLQDEHARANDHHHDVILERPMLIDPASEDPRDHIRFHNEEPCSLSDRGRYTIELLLRHPGLDEDRRTHCKRLAILKESLKVLSTFDSDETRKMATEIEAELASAIQPDAEYSSMAIDLISRP